MEFQLFDQFVDARHQSAPGQRSSGRDYAESGSGGGERRFGNASQVCISTQRVFADRRIYSDFLDALVSPTAAFPTGNPLDEAVKMGPMIRTSDAERVSRWIAEAVNGGARVMVGGDHEGMMHAPLGSARPAAPQPRGRRLVAEEVGTPAGP